MNKEKTVFVGIDHSYTSPAFTVYDSVTDHFTCYFLTKIKKCQGTFRKGNITFIGEPSLEGVLSGSDRYYKIANWVLDKLKNNHPDASEVLIEGYSMNSRGSRTFEIGENAGMLKYALMNSGFNIILKSPREIKKFFTGNGGVGKYSVERDFNKEVGFDIRDVIPSKAENPVSDICDSYSMCQMLRTIS